MVYSVSSKNEERSSLDRWSGANVIEMCGAPSHLRMQELAIEGRMVRHLKDLYSRRDGGDRLKRGSGRQAQRGMRID